MLEEIHPLEDTPICVAFPWLGIFTMCGVPNYPKTRKEREAAEAAENHGLDSEVKDPLLKKKTTMMVNGKEVKKKSKKKKKNNINDPAKFEAEPLARLGFGIVAYTDALWGLILFFACFSILLAPTMSFFHHGTGYQTVNPKVVAYEYGMLGNLGYSSVQCASIPLDVGQINMMCPFGKIGEIYDSGINQKDSDATNCAENDEIKACHPNSAAFTAAMTASIGKANYLYEFPTQDLWKTQASKDECFASSGKSRLFI